MDLTARVVERFLAAKIRDKAIPVKNKETGRTVYVLPETLKKDPDKFKKIPPDKAGDPRWRGKPKPPKRPQKPDKPDVPRDAPPAPIKPQIPARRVKPTQQVTDVPDVAPMKIPKPSPKRRWKKPKKFSPAR